MSITLKTNSVHGAGFIANGYSADWSGCEAIVAAVTGKSIYVERIYINAQDAEVFTFGAGETGGAVTTTILGPIATAGSLARDMAVTRTLMVTAATALVVDATGATAATIIVQGFIR